MNNLTERDLIKRVAEKYQREGYETIIEPGQEYIPFDLGNYRPDLLAFKDENNGYIFEIKKDKSYVSIDQIKEVASSTDSHDGWHFILVTGDDVLLEETKGVTQDTVLSWNQIISEKEKAEKFFDLEEYEISFLIFWRTIDAMMRNFARKINIPIERLPTSSLINHLYSQGELSIEEFDNLSRLKKFRNQLAHGFQTEIQKSDIEELKKIIDDLIIEWNQS